MKEMLPLRHIVFPYDFSAPARQAVPFVRAFAQSFDALVTIVSVVPPVFEPLPLSMGPRLRTGHDPAKWQASLQSKLDHALVEEFAGLHVDRVAMVGDPALRITEMAEHADLVMMFTHGLGVFRRLLVGSVTSKVLHDARCPVWTAAHAEIQRATELPRSILCAVDRTPRAATLAKWASEFSAHLNARLTFLDVACTSSDWRPWEKDRQLHQTTGDDAHREVASMLESARVGAPVRVAVGEITSTIAAEVRQEHADLMIIGRGTASEPFVGLRTAFGIVQSSPCPVVSVVV